MVDLFIYAKSILIVYWICCITINTEILGLSANQSWQFINRMRHLALQLINMQKTASKFEEIAQKVSDLASFSIILQKQQFIYDIQPYRIEDSPPSKMVKAYLSLKNRHQIAQNEQNDADSWNQNERRIFIWFIICYTFFTQLDPQSINEEFWVEMSSIFFGKKPQFLQFQYLNLLKQNKRIDWSKKEDSLLTECIALEDNGRWKEVSKRIFYSSGKTIFKSPKHCRERWLNHLDRSKKHGEWSVKEDALIFQHVIESDKRWSKMVPLLQNTRTEHMIKNRYNSIINKNRINKNQKEEQIAEIVLKNLNKELENEQNSDSKTKSNNQKQQNSAAVQEKQDSVVQRISTQSGHLNEEQENPSLNANIINNDYNYAYFLSFPQLMLMNQMLCPQNQFLQLGGELVLSKNSNFSYYNEPARSTLFSSTN